jgi:hypothetical protein
MCFTGPLARHCTHCRTPIRHDQSYQSFCYSMILTGECDQQTIKEPHDWTIVYKDGCADCKLDENPRSAIQSQSRRRNQGQSEKSDKHRKEMSAKAQPLRNDGSDEDKDKESESTSHSETSEESVAMTKTSSTSTSSTSLLTHAKDTTPRTTPTKSPRSSETNRK